MNVQDVINMALNGQDGRAVEPVEHRTCADEQIAKLASALNFIGANLEDSVLTPGEILAQAELIKEAASPKQRQRRKKLRQQRRAEDVREQRRAARVTYALTNPEPPPGKPARAPGSPLVPERLVPERPVFSAPSVPSTGETPKRPLITNTKSRVGGRLRKKVLRSGKTPRVTVPQPSSQPNTPGADSIGSGNNMSDSAPASAKRSFMDLVKETTGIKRVNSENFLGKRGLRAGGTATVLGGLGYGGKKLYDRYQQDQQQKRASVDDVLAYAAHVGKQALLEKVAEDRINPAKISAGPAAPYSGEVMPACSPVFGGQTTPAQLVAMKAQKVRDRINSDMKQYVSNVGDGYNLQGHLNKFNK